MCYVIDSVGLIVSRAQIHHSESSYNTSYDFDRESLERRRDRMVASKSYTYSNCVNSYSCIPRGVDLYKTGALVDE